MRTVNFSIGLPEEMVNKLEQKIDRKTYMSRNAVIKTAVSEFLDKDTSIEVESKK